MFYFNKWMLNLYVDIQNVYNFKGDSKDSYITVLDSSGNPVVDSTDPTRYVLKKIKNDGSGTILPTVGVILEF
jgi:hypothetical protein